MASEAAPLTGGMPFEHSQGMSPTNRSRERARTIALVVIVVAVIAGLVLSSFQTV